jgi:integrase/recombinase XerD
MKLARLTAEYVTFKQSLGTRFRTESVILKAFCGALGDIDISQVSPRSVQDYLAGTGSITAFWHRKFEALSGFYRWAISRGHVFHSPLPLISPKRPITFQPYIYTLDEYRSLVQMTHVLDESRTCKIQASPSGHFCFCCMVQAFGSAKLYH